ncbi:MAG TPA: SMC-Scp complex subunit ScpB [Jatrophihabitans sp.]|nr:SMC-Scp complex subunit ScpB [Jatrophihabitans sp.]
MTDQPADDAVAAAADDVPVQDAAARPGTGVPISVDRSGTPSMDLADPAVLRGALEALLFVADAPLELSQLAAAVQRPVTEVAESLAGITADLDARETGWQLRPAATGFRLYTRERYAPIIEAYLLEGQRSKLSQAALETLAVIAYRQPVTRAKISAIRGVNVDGVVRTLLTRELITEDGTDPLTGGGLYRTTPTFLEKMGIASVDELPSLAPLLPELDTLDADEL